MDRLRLRAAVLAVERKNTRAAGAFSHVFFSWLTFLRHDLFVLKKYYAIMGNCKTYFNSGLTL
jgi:hypothetical protein